MSRLIARLIRLMHEVWRVVGRGPADAYVSAAWLRAHRRQEDGAGIDGVCWAWDTLRRGPR